MKTSSILAIIALWIGAAFAVAIQQNSWLPPSGIQVNAGADKVLCQYQNLVLADLQASITGEVEDGDWFTFGDGRFQPGNLLTVRFSIARQGNITYVPGTADKALGTYRLMLMSDVPVLNPQERATDEVRISFQAPPPMFCNSNFTISLDEFCRQKVDVTMLHPNPAQPFDFYQITLFDKNGVQIPGNILTNQHVNTEVSYRLGHQCTTNHCFGRFKVDDYYPPVFVCRNDTISCDRSSTPDSVGLPIPKRAIIDTVIQGKFLISQWDYCSQVVLEYKDEVIAANCLKNEEKTIRRQWVATDGRGNRATCVQQITVQRLSMPKVQFPGNFDGQNLPAFQCLDTFPVLPNGHPSPDTTGFPTIGYCGHLQYNYQDVRFQMCGNGFKVARSWFVIDWCSSEGITRLQTIEVRDSRPPVIQCADTIRMMTKPYECMLIESEIPLPNQLFDCSTVRIEYSVADAANLLPVSANISKIGNQSFISDLPVGEYILYYHATDACQNISTCSSVLRVEDHIAPSAVCHQSLVVSLDNAGKGRLNAASLDDGSTDNCGIGSFSVRKQNGNCHLSDKTSTWIEFCCEEINANVMAELQVTDIHGNLNSCMVAIRVDDKLAPTITCPPNLSVSCSDNLSPSSIQAYGKVVNDPSLVSPVVIQNDFHQGRVGYDGLATDNCHVQISERISQNLTCYTGFVERLFKATDSRGLSDSCTQRIFVQNPMPFSEKYIQWPAHYEGQGCRTSQTTPVVTGRPVFTFQDCANVSSSYEDQSFFTADGACLKIFRHWTVIDWCQFDEAGSKGKFGPYTQIIKIHNSDSPEFTAACKDTLICMYDSQCKSVPAVITNQAHDPCTPDEDLLYSFAIDLSSDGQTDYSGAGKTLRYDLPLGVHLVFWQVADQCGNTTSCRQEVVVEDCKAPSPYCYGALTGVLDQVNGGFVLPARDLDKGGTDNCTANLFYTFGSSRPVSGKLQEKHYFSNGQLADMQSYLTGKALQWLPSNRTAARFFNCNDIPDGKSATLPVTLTIWDEKGNSDYCETQLILQDNHGICPDVVTTSTISGRITTEMGKVPVKTLVEFKALEKEGNVPLDALGTYLIPDMPVLQNIAVRPFLDTDPLEGITTMDLVMIQRHILGVAPFTSPFQRIAADVNGSASISASDILDLRRLILGIHSTFPKGVTSWVFADKKAPFYDPAYPFSYKSMIDTLILSSGLTQLDFVAIKKGDVNGSALTLADQPLESRRGVRPFLLEAEIVQNGPSEQLVLRAAEDAELFGFQLFLDQPGSKLNLLAEAEGMQGTVFQQNSRFITEGRISMLGYEAMAFPVRQGDVLAEIPWNNLVALSELPLSSGSTSEVYTKEGCRPVQVRVRPKPEIQPNFSLVSNVVSSHPVLEWKIPGVEKCHTSIMLFDVHGNLISSDKHHLEGEGRWQVISCVELPIGMYYVRISHQHDEITLPFAILR